MRHASQTGHGSRAAARAPMGPGRRQSRRARRPRWIDCIEHCEPRRLLAVTLENVPSWVEQGPGPIVGGQTAGLPDDPVTGAVEAIAVRPGSPNTVVIGTTNGGVWRTTDITASPVSWTPLSDDLPSLAISSIAYSPFDTSNQTIFAGTGNFSNSNRPGGQSVGIFRSTNNGASWTVLGQATFAGVVIRKVVPAVQTLTSGARLHVVLVASSSGVHRSTDGGNTFTRVSGTNGLPAGAASEIVADPSAAGLFFAAAPGVGIFSSNNFGASWNRVDANGVTGIDTANTNIELATHFNATARTRAVYAGIIRNITTPTNSNPRPRLVNVFRSADGGASWSAIGTAPAIHPGGQGIRNFAIVADPVSSTVVYVGGDRQDNIPFVPFVGNLFRGNAANNTWTSVVLNGANGTAPHADCRSLVFVNATDILEADDGGIYRLNNAGSTQRRWAPLVGNLRLAQFVSVAYDPARNRILGGMQDTGSADQTGEITSAAAQRFRWNQMLALQGDGGFVDVDLVRTNALGGLDPLRYASSNQLSGFQRIGPLDVFPSFIGMNIVGGGGRHLTDEDPQGNRVFDTTLPLATPMVLNRIRSERLMIGSNFLYESTDRGDNLTVLGGALTNLNNNNADDDNDGQTDEGDEFAPPGGGNVGRVTSMAYGGRSGGTDFPNALYVGTNTAAPFLRFRATGTGLPAGVAAYPGVGVRDVTFEAGDFRSAYVVDDNSRVWRGANVGLSGESWQDITGNLIDPQLETVEVVGSGILPVVMVGGVNGVYRLDPNSNVFSWTEFGLSLPNTPVTDLRWNPQDDVLLAGTNGRGAWTISGVSNVIRLDPILRITGTTSADAAVIATSASNPTLVDVALNGVVSRFPVSVINRVIFTGSGGDDSFALNFTGGPFAPPAGIDVNGGSGNDSFLLTGGQATQDVYFADPDSDDTTSLITFTGGPVLTVEYDEVETVRDEIQATEFIVTATTGTNNVTLDDGQATFDGRLRVQMSTPSLSRTYPSIEFFRKRDVVLNADPASIIFGGDDSVSIGNTEAAFEQQSLTVLGRIGDDTIAIGGSFVPTTVSGFSGDDTIQVGQFLVTTVNNLPNFSFTLTLIDAPLFIDGGGGTDALSILSTNSGGGGTAEITNSAVTGLGMAAGGIVYDGMQSLSLSTSGLNDSIRVRSTGTPLTINSGSGNDLVRLGSAGTTTAAASGNVNSIFSVTVNGGAGTDSLVFDDSGDSAAASVTVTSTGISGLGSVTRDAAVETVIAHLGSGGDSVVVRSLGSGTSLTLNAGGGSDLVRLGSAGSGVTVGSGLVNDVDGQISVAGGTGTDSLVLDDSGDTVANSATVGTTSVNGLGMLAGANFSSLESLTLFTGSGNDVVTNNVPAGSNPVVVANLDGGEDGLIVPATGSRGDVVTVGWDFLAIPGIPVTQQQAANNLVPHRDVLVATVNGVVYRTEYNGGETIFVRAGNGDDIVTTAPVAGRFWTMDFEGGNGNDSLAGGDRDDRIAGGTGDDRLTGGVGNDRLVGGNGDDRLFGDAGRDTLDGGSGQDQLTGGAGEDLLIGGRGADAFFARDGEVDRLDVDAADGVIERDPVDVLV